MEKLFVNLNKRKLQWERESNIIYKSTVRPENFLYTNYNWSIRLSKVHPAVQLASFSLMFRAGVLRKYSFFALISF